MGDVTSITTGRKRVTKPQKNAGAVTPVTKADFLTNDEVLELTALKTRLAEALAKPDIHERDLKAVSVEYRAVRLELQDAKDRAVAKKLGRRAGAGASGDRSFNGDI